MSARHYFSPDEATALEELHQRGWTDGLPVVVPTPARVEQMMLGGGLDPDIILGSVGPALGEATIEKVAVNAVMAGCLPDHFPVVIAAVRAVCDERFDLGMVQCTTHGVAPVVIVNGPARLICGNIASGWGALGPGHRANMCIGRALRLVLMNLGGARPGVSDMAVLGHGGKVSACLAEAEESSPFPPLHVSRGMDAEQSAVTVIGVDSPHSVMCAPDGDDPAGAERILRTLAGAIANPGANSTYGGIGTTLVVLNPDHARKLSGAGYSREGVQRRLHELAVTTKDVLNSYAPTHLYPRDQGAELVHAIGSPERVIVAVAGGEGIYSSVFGAWGVGAHGVLPVTTEVEVGQACALPGYPGTGPVAAVARV